MERHRPARSRALAWRWIPALSLVGLLLGVAAPGAGAWLTGASSEPPAAVVDSEGESNELGTGETSPGPHAEAAVATVGDESETWQPGPAVYGVKMTQNVTITMNDGNVLMADLYEPADLATGEVAPGPFPVLLTITPYNKRGTGDTYLVSRGYIHAVVDQRGRGNSQGDYGYNDPRDAEDGAELVQWGSKLPGSNGNVGMLGASNLGIIQLRVAQAVGPDSPLKAIVPNSASNSAYREIAFPGGLQSTAVNQGIGSVLLPAWGVQGPIQDYNGDPGGTAAREVQGLDYINTTVLGNALTGATNSPTGTHFYSRWWEARDPGTLMPNIVHNDVATLLLGGWYDVFQRGTMMNFVALQNTVAGRAPYLPILDEQELSPKYQLVQGPFFHSPASGAPELLHVDKLMLRWFDRWLKDIKNGVDETETPLHVWEVHTSVPTTGRWIETTRWPLADKATTYYLGSANSGAGAPSMNDGALTDSAPAIDETDQIVWTAVTGPCNSAAAAVLGGHDARCSSDDRANQTGPGVLTYTTAPFTVARTIAGPVDATIRLTSSTVDAEMIATLEDVAEDGTSMPITNGALLGQHRALDNTQSWRDADGKLLRPFHPFTAAASKPIAADEIATLDLDLGDALWKIAPGHRLRLTIRTGNTPWAETVAGQLANLLGGVYQIQRTIAAPSYINIPFVDSDSLPPTGCSICQP